MEMHGLEKNIELIQTVQQQGVRDRKVLRAMKAIDRKYFVPHGFQKRSYLNRPLSIGSGQTISQPFIVAVSLECLKIKSSDQVLEIGTGSGYQTAILGLLAKKVFSIEIIEALAIGSKEVLQRLGYKNIETRLGDGNLGWPEKAPFDKIILSAAAPHLPPTLLEQLKVGGIMVMPLGSHRQTLVQITKTKNGYDKKEILPVVFVPLTGNV